MNYILIQLMFLMCDYAEVMQQMTQNADNGVLMLF